MPITGPNRKTKDKVRYSEFVLCEGFVFKPNSVESFYHDSIAEGAGVTIVNIKSFKHEVADPNRRLFDFLVSRVHPMPPDEHC